MKEDTKKEDRIFVSQEYKLVPVADQEVTKNPNNFSIIDLLGIFWRKKHLIVRFMLGGFALGLIIALLAPKEYQASAKLMPEDSSNGGISGGLLEKYGGMLGLGAGLDFTEGGNIPLNLYPELVESLPFQLKLLNEEVYFESYDTAATIYLFLKDIYPANIKNRIREFTIGLPSKVISVFSSDLVESKLPDGFEVDKTLKLTKAQMKIVDNLRHRVGVIIDENAGLIQFVVEMPDAGVSAELAMKGIKLIEEYVTNYKTKKSLETVAFLSTQHERAKRDFESIQNELAAFMDSNINLTSARANTEKQKLESKFNLYFNIYNSLSQQLEQARLNLQEQTPIFTILEPAQVPIDDTTSGLFILIANILLSIFIGITFVLIREYFNLTSQ